MKAFVGHSFNKKDKGLIQQLKSSLNLQVLNGSQEKAHKIPPFQQKLKHGLINVISS
jgi:hypothetical protein